MARGIAAFLALGLLTLGVNTALADDLYPPFWRDWDNSTLQVWEFDDDDNPALPEFVNNPWAATKGDPTVTFFGTFPYTYWYDVEGDQEGVWMTNDVIEVYVPNTDITNPESFKLIQIQMTYDAGPGYNPNVYIGTDVFAPVHTEPAAGTYTFGIWEIYLQPNPPEETILIQPRFCALYLDELVIDTLCVVPEPATISFLALGGLAVLLIKRRS